jgi:MSHA biogenesis protein MshK
VYKKISNVLLIIFSFFTLGINSSISYSAQDPTRPPSWMTGAAEINTSKKVLILQQILISDNRKIAVINDTLVSEGDMIEGAKVNRIDPDWVSIVRSGRRITLRLVPTIKESINE